MTCYTIVFQFQTISFDPDMCHIELYDIETICIHLYQHLSGCTYEFVSHILRITLFNNIFASQQQLFSNPQTTQLEKNKKKNISFV